MLQDRSNQCGLARADLTGQDDEPFAAANAGEQFFERRSVRGAAIEKSGISGEAERFFLEAVVRFVRERRGRAGRHDMSLQLEWSRGGPGCPFRPESRVRHLLAQGVPPYYRRNWLSAVAVGIGGRGRNCTRDSGFGIRDPDLGLRDPGSGIRDPGAGIRVGNPGSGGGGSGNSVLGPGQAFVNMRMRGGPNTAISAISSRRPHYCKDDRRA